MFPEPVIDADNEPYWSGAAAGELRFPYCTRCARFWYPPGPVCPRCQRTEFEWRTVEGRGVVGCAVRYHKQYFPEVAVPYVVAQVDLPCGVRMSATVVGDGGPATELPPPGTAVEVVYRETAGRTVPAVRVCR